jgi:hypothetical protein
MTAVVYVVFLSLTMLCASASMFFLASYGGSLEYVEMTELEVGFVWYD